MSNDPEKYRHNYLTSLSILAFFALPLSAALTLIGKDVILLLLGSQWIRAGQIFCVFGLSIGVAVIYFTYGWLHLSLGTPDRWFRWSIVEFTVSLVFFVIGLRFGALGVAIAYSASFLIR
jgi:PST family polysaccharide transporter